ncbi:unnamed protein product [Brachionus calyciflorus]|uniref:Uncharacterized protein n=1 Tax=Brachionus calyciflorus TaxID=104777 RepID=A0A813ML85_9BILA|nr:unnamed protein product [Brachionus calyciflorus]
MSTTRNIVSEYYESLINGIDIHTEKLISFANLTEIELTNVNSTRSKYLNEISKIKEENLSHLESNKQDNSNMEFIFQPKFCFFIPRLDTELKLPYTLPFDISDPFSKFDFFSEVRFFSQTNIYFGILVITHQFFSQATIDCLKIKLNELDRDINLTTPKDEVDFNILQRMITSKMENIISAIFDRSKQFILERNFELKIIDLSDPKENKLDTFVMKRKNFEHFQPSDFASFEIMTDRNRLLKFKLNLDDLTGVQESLFRRLNWIQDLSFFIEKCSLIKPKYFENLKQLESLKLPNIQNQTLNNSLFMGLEYLKILELNDGQIEFIDDNTFVNLSSLIELKLNSNKIRQLNDGAFKGLNNLMILHLNHNKIEYLSSKCFQDLKKLKFLSLEKSFSKKVDLKCLNDLENLIALKIEFDNKMYIDLNYDELVLPSLKYLTIHSQRLPDCKTKQLVFLLIIGLKHLDENSFESQSQLKSIQIRTNSNLFSKINKKNFSHLKKMCYLIVEFVDIKYNGKNMFEDNQKYFASFLCEQEPLHVNTTRPNYFSVSNYESLNCFFQHFEAKFEVQIIDFLGCYDYFRPNRSKANCLASTLFSTLIMP